MQGGTGCEIKREPEIQSKMKQLEAAADNISAEISVIADKLASVMAEPIPRAEMPEKSFPDIRTPLGDQIWGIIGRLKEQAYRIQDIYRRIEL